MAEGDKAKGWPMGPQERGQAADVPLLRGLPPEQLDYLLQGATLQRVPKGTTLFEEGGEPECLHLLLSGSVEAFTHEEGRDHTVWIMSQHDVFMPSAAIIDELYLLSARTLKPSRLLLLRVDRVREEMARCPHFACRLAKLLAGRLRATIRHLKDLKTRTGAQRLAAYLIRLIDAHGTAGSAELPVSKGTLASRLGMSPETMSRALQTVAAEGLVVRGHRVFLQDRARAERFCRHNPLIDGSESWSDVRGW